MHKLHIILVYKLCNVHGVHRLWIDSKHMFLHSLILINLYAQVAYNISAQVAHIHPLWIDSCFLIPCFHWDCRVVLSWWVAQLLHLIMRYVFLEFWICWIYYCLLDLDGNLVIKLVELVTSPLSPIMILLNVPLVRILIYVSPSPVVILFFLCVPPL